MTGIKTFRLVLAALIALTYLGHEIARAGDQEDCNSVV